jgi:hypothetical protein
MKQISGELSMDHDPNHEASELAWVRLDELVTTLSHGSEKRIAQVALSLIGVKN